MQKASNQKILGRWAWIRSVRPILVMCLIFHSEMLTLKEVEDAKKLRMGRVMEKGIRIFLNVKNIIVTSYI